VSDSVLMPEGRMRRGAIAVEIAGHRGDAIVCASVHLKSASIRSAPRAAGETGSLTRAEWATARVLATQQRLAEAAALRLVIDDALTAPGPPRHCAILGDLNDTATSEVATLLAGPNGRDATTDGLRLYPTWPPGSGAYRTIDHVLVTRDLRLRASGAETVPIPWRSGWDPEAPPVVWPDHAPVWVDVAWA